MRTAPARTLLALFSLTLPGCGLELGYPIGENAPGSTSDGLRIFVSSATVSGAIAGSGAIAAADNLCDTDSNRPSTSATYRALLSDGTNRSGTVNGQIDWPLRASQKYVRRDGTTVIGTTNSNATLSPTGSVSTTGYSVWTGLNADYSHADDCNGFRTDLSTVNGRVGVDTSTGTGAVSSGSNACNAVNHLYCVEI